MHLLSGVSVRRGVLVCTTGRHTKWTLIRIRPLAWHHGQPKANAKAYVLCLQCLSPYPMMSCRQGIFRVVVRTQYNAYPGMKV
eukprot:scaffold471381_cov18-Prasinocladus_malaysianus.AAC.1